LPATELNMNDPGYFMESETESLRLDLKTDARAVEAQARWAGVVPGMRVVDLGCGAGIVTSVLHRLAQPGGEVVGVDISERRIDYARAHYGQTGIRYLRRDVREGLSDLGRFDLAWMRFLLEYHAQRSYEIASSAYALLGPGGTLCLIDLDQNCLGHFGAPARLDKTMRAIVLAMQQRHAFDPFVGRKLYAFLCDLGCADIEVRMEAHHLIYGRLSDADRFNWLAKAEAARGVPGLLDEYPNGYQEFRDELVAYLEHPRRFLYTPLILCKGTKPATSG
jgi:2-polyprenyl-3-methyl-5-hydroxy-6-metoxy-1,4-benzoquinol methylase